MDKLDKITWTENFSVGHKTLDEQHFKIVSYINELIDMPAITKQSVALEYITKMLVYSREHLDYEEQLLNDNDYPDASSHAVIHTFYVKKVENFLKMSFVDDYDFRTDVLNFLKEWWTYHILEEDMKYRPFVEGKGLA
jgi:hemerythrin